MTVFPVARERPGVLTVVSDTHGTDSHRLAGRTLEAVRRAEVVVHAGDFTTEAVLAAFEREAGAARDGPGGGSGDAGDEGDEGDGNGGQREGQGQSRGQNHGQGNGQGQRQGRAEGRAGGRVLGVVGNNDDAALRARLPETRVVEWEGARLVVVHGHEHGETGLNLLGRQEGADLVVVGHSHQPAVTQTGAVTVLNPGSHADPRWHRPAHAELEATGEGLGGRLVGPDGAVLERFELSVTGRA